MGLSSLSKRSIRGSDRHPPIGRRAPLRVALVDAPDDVHVGAEHAPGEHADLAVPEREAIDRDDRCDLVCRLLLEKKKAGVIRLARPPACPGVLTLVPPPE